MDTLSSCHLGILQAYIKVDEAAYHLKGVGDLVDHSKGLLQKLIVETIQTPDDEESVARLILQLQDILGDLPRAAGMVDTLLRELTIAKTLVEKLLLPAPKYDKTKNSPA